VAERVHFLGFTRDLPGLLRCLDAFVLPSLSEGFPNTLVEAMATGLPCVSTGLCSIPEIVEDGRSGLLVEAGDMDGLEAAIERLLSDASLRRRLGAEARARVEEAFSLEATTNRFEGYVQSIVARARGSAERRGRA